MKTTIACVQMQSALGQKSENLKKMKENVVAIMKDPQVDLIVFPELAVTGYECSEQYRELAEPFPGGSSITQMAETAKQFHVFIAFGFIEKAIKDGKEVLYNSVALMDKQGQVLGQ